MSNDAGDAFERPVSPRRALGPDPASQPTPVRDDRTTIRPAQPGPPVTPPSGRFSRPVDRYEIPVELPPPPPRKIGWRRLVTFVVVIVVVGVTAGWGYVRFLHNPSPDQATVVSPGPTQGPKIERADDLVRQYLNALAAGDTETAMALGAVGSGSPAAITPEAYARSLTAFPITDISVPAVDTATTEVPATYHIGTREVNTRFRVVRDDTGSWELANSTVQVELQNPNAPDMPVLLNGVPVRGGIAEVLPGHYTVTTGLPLVDYPESNAVEITNLEYDGRVQRVLTPVLTDAGRQALLRAGRTALDACLASGSLAPPDCPNRLASSGPYDPASVRWQLLGDPFRDANPALDPADQSRGQVSMVLRLQVSFSYTDGSTNGTQQLPPVSASFAGSILAARAADVTVTWSRAG